MDSILDAQVVNFERDPEEKKRSIIIDNLGISATDFDLTNDQKTQLYNSGKKYATQYLSAIAETA